MVDKDAEQGKTRQEVREEGARIVKKRVKLDPIDHKRIIQEVVNVNRSIGEFFEKAMPALRAVVLQFEKLFKFYEVNDIDELFTLWADKLVMDRDELEELSIDTLIDRLNAAGISTPGDLDTEPLAKPLPPNYLLFLNSKVSNELAEYYDKDTGEKLKFLNEGEIPVDLRSETEKKKGVKPIEVHAVLQIDPATWKAENIEIRGINAFTFYDRLVFDALCTLYHSGYSFFTTQDVYRVMTYYKHRNISSNILSDIQDSVLKMTSCIFSLDISEEVVRRKNIKTTKRIRENERFMDLKLKTKETVIETPGGGEKTTRIEVLGFTFKGKPPLLEYSEEANRLLTIPEPMLLASSVVSNSRVNVQIKAKVCHRVLNMIGDKKQQRRINYKNLLYDIGFKTESREVLRKKREVIKTILDSYKKDGIIEDYHEYKSKTGSSRGGSPGIAGAVITLPEDPKKIK